MPCFTTFGLPEKQILCVRRRKIFRAFSSIHMFRQSSYKNISKAVDFEFNTLKDSTLGKIAIKVVSNLQMSIARAYNIQNRLHLHQNEAYLFRFAMEKSTTRYETDIPCESSIFHREPCSAISGAESDINIFKYAKKDAQWS